MLSVAVDAPLLIQLISFTTLVAVLVSFRPAGWIARIMAGLFLGGGSLILLQVLADPVALLFGFGEMVYIVALFAVLPMLSIPIRMFHYDEAFSQFFHALSASLREAYLGIVLISYFLGFFLSLASVPLVFRTVEKSVVELGVPEHHRFINISLVQGFVGPMVWTPFSGSLGVTVFVFSTSWLSLLPMLLTVAMLSTGLSLGLFFVLQMRQFKAPVSTSGAVLIKPKLEPSTLKQLLELFLIVVGFIGVVFILEAHFHLSLVITLILITGPFTLAWILAKGGGRYLASALPQHFQEHFRAMAGTYLVFMSAGFFLNAFEVSGYDNLISGVFAGLLQVVGSTGFLIFFPLLVSLMAFMAIHPIVFLILISGALTTDVVGLPPEAMAMAFLAGCVVNFIVSPYSGLVSLVRHLTPMKASQIIAVNMPTALVSYLSYLLAMAFFY